MPNRFNNAGGFGGFAGFATTMRRKPVTGDNEWNPLLQDEGNNNYVFPTPIPSGGSSGTPRPTPTPRATPRPTPTPAPQSAPDMYENERGVTRNTPSITVFPSGPDYAGTQGDDVYSGNFGEDTYTHTAGAETSRLEPSFLFGDPTVETLTASSTRSAGNLDLEPSLFPSPVGSNPFDEWWKSGTESVPSVTVNAGDSGGSIWSGDETLSNFGNDVALGNDLSADLGSLGYGEDYPAAEALAPESPFNPIADGSGIPVEPDPLNQDVGDLEYTTNPDDRRFLPGSETTIEPEPVRSVAATGGANIRDFGGHSFDNRLSLGAYLNMPLAALRYGEGVSGGDVAYAGGVEHTPGSGGPSVQIPTAPAATGQVQIDSQTGQPFDLETIPEGVAVSPEVRRGELVAEPVTEPATGAMSPRAYERATMGGVRSTGYRDTRGSSTFDPRAARLQLMASQSFGGSVNNPGQGDEGMSRRWGMIGRLNEAGEYEETGRIDPSFRSNIENYRGFVYGSQRSTARGRMAPAFAGRGG